MSVVITDTGHVWPPANNVLNLTLAHGLNLAQAVHDLSLAFHDLSLAVHVLRMTSVLVLRLTSVLVLRLSLTCTWSRSETDVYLV